MEIAFALCGFFSLTTRFVLWIDSYQ